MSEYKTLKEILGDKTRSSGLKLAIKAYPSDVWFEPLFRPTYTESHNNEYWHGVNSHGEYQRFSELVQVKEWHPPKKKLTKYLWYNTKENSLLRYFATNKENLFYQIQCGSPNAFLNHESYYIRLDWSATEFDDE